MDKMRKTNNVIFEGISYGCILCVIATVIELQFSKNGLVPISILLYGKQLFCGVILGMAIAFGRIFYEEGKISKTIQSVVSFTTSCAIYLIALLKSEWFGIENPNQKIPWIIIVAIVVILLSWIFVYLYNRREIRKMNQKIELNKKI